MKNVLIICWGLAWGLASAQTVVTSNYLSAIPQSQWPLELDSGSVVVVSKNLSAKHSLANVYYSMSAQVQLGARKVWCGNIKKLRLEGRVLRDAAGKQGINQHGGIDAQARSFWSKGIDGDQVVQGGVMEMFQQIDLKSRNLWTDHQADGELLKLTHTRLHTQADPAAWLAEEKIAGKSQGLTLPLAWYVGMDVDDVDGDGDRKEIRADLLTMMHGVQPIVIHFAHGNTKELRFILLTAKGVVHLFADHGDTVVESWAYIPSLQLARLVSKHQRAIDLQLSDPQLRRTPQQSIKIYRVDRDHDGYIDAARGDKAWLFIGIEGHGYTGLDISEPDQPQLLWSSQTLHRKLLSITQHWSLPELIELRDKEQPSKTRPVLVFAARYTQTDQSAISAQRTKQRHSTTTGIFMLDAQTGELIWSLSASPQSRINQHDTQIVNQISAPITPLDTDGDGVTDRFYTIDHNGNIWRFDLPTADPFAADRPWTVFKLAILANRDAQSYQFSQALVVQSAIFSQLNLEHQKYQEHQVNQINRVSNQSRLIKKEIPFEVIIATNGDPERFNFPDDLNNQDQHQGVFVVQDRNIMTGSLVDDKPAPILVEDLYDVTHHSLIAGQDHHQWLDIAIAMGTTKGWYYRIDNDERLLATIALVRGVIYFNTYTRFPVNARTWYAVDMHYGLPVNGQLAYSIGDQAPIIPQLFSGINTTGHNELLWIGVDPCHGNPCETPGVFVAKEIRLDGVACRMGRCFSGQPKLVEQMQLKTFRHYFYLKESKHSH